MFEVYIDGASAGDGGPSGIGIFIKGPNGSTEEYAIPVNAENNHQAEFMAVIEALKICLEKTFLSISIRTDSQIVDTALNRHYVKNPLFKPYLDAFEKLESTILKGFKSYSRKYDMFIGPGDGMKCTNYYTIRR